jgi:nucleotide-binding universal stress UspA family protein
MSFEVGMKTIVVATDLNGQSEAALEYARKLAGAYGARIVLAHGIDPVDYAAVDAVPSLVLKGLSEEARAALDAMAGDLLREGIPSHSEIRQGAVAQMLVDVARHQGNRGRRTGDCGRGCRAVGAGVALSGAGGRG